MNAAAAAAGEGARSRPRPGTLVTDGDGYNEGGRVCGLHPCECALLVVLLVSVGGGESVSVAWYGLRNTGRLWKPETVASLALKG